MVFLDNQPYSNTVHERIAIANTFEELAQIAIGIILAMPTPVGIVCGPITTGGHGTMEANIAEFERRITQLAREGNNIFNQMPFEPRMQVIKKTPYYRSGTNHLLETFYGTIFQLRIIRNHYFIPGWEGSYGARWEHDFIKQLGGSIIYLLNTSSHEAVKS